MLTVSLSLFVAAFVAGVLMFIAPCTFPLIPAYLAVISGVDANGRADAPLRGKILKNATAFLLGFSVVFIVLGTAAGLFGGLLTEYREFIMFAAGVLVIFIGLVVLGVVSGSSNGRGLPIPSISKRGKSSTSFVLGTSIAFGWSPCIGPVLATVLLLAAEGGSWWIGASLLAAFSLGFSVPFLLVALFFTHLGSVGPRVTKVADIARMIGGVTLVALGLLLLFDKLGWLAGFSVEVFSALGLEFILDHY